MTEENIDFIESLAKSGGALERSLTNPDLFQFGCIVGVVDLFECVTFAELPATRHRYATWYRLLEVSPAIWAEGPHCFLFRNPHHFARPIPARGALNIWRLPPALMESVGRELAIPSSEPVEYRGR